MEESRGEVVHTGGEGRGCLRWQRLNDIRRVWEVSSWGVNVSWVDNQIDWRGRIQTWWSCMNCHLLCENGLLHCVIARSCQDKRVRVKMLLAVMSE